MTSRPVRAVVVMGALATIVGCAGVPDSGGVHLGQPVATAGGGFGQGSVREVPAGPLPDASPVQLVSGFLRAMVDGDNSYGVARSYLARGTSWTATTGITVYAEPPIIKRVDADRVVVRMRRVGVIAPSGVYRVATGTIARAFRVTRRTGEWRISRLDAGALLSTDDAQRALQPASVYFLTPDGRRLVPERVLEPPDEPGLATTLMRVLLAGPDPFLAPGVRTAAPRGTLLVGNVPISAEGVAEVDLSAGAREITPAQLERLSAQISWTLRQIGSVTAVRLLANGAPLASSEAPSVQPVDAWLQYDPDAPPTALGALLVHDGKVAGLGATVPSALGGARLLNPVRSADGTLVAALRRTPQGEALLMGSADGPLRVRLRSGGLTAPTFTPDGQVLVATATGAVYSVGLHEPARLVELASDLRAQPIRTLAVSRDGTRLAIVTGASSAQLRVATLVAVNGRLSTAMSRVVLPATSAVAGAAWTDADQLVATVRASDGTRHVVEVGVDGYTAVDLSEPGLPGDVREVAAAPGQPVLASGPTGTWRLTSRRWERVSGGTSPSYAG